MRAMRYPIRSLLTVTGLLLVASACVGTLHEASARQAAVPSTKSSSVDRNFSMTGRRRILTGHSVDGRRLVAERVGNASSARRILVVGCIHGNECAGVPVARDLISDRPMRAARLVVVPDLNPDGRAMGTRQNARGVDLNRNFPWRWQPIGAPGSLFYSGPHALSEPESRFARHLVRRIRPSISIWFHQHMDLVDRSGGNVAIERRYARIVGLPLRRLPRYPGSATGWENHRLSHSTAFVVELPSGHLSPKGVERFSDGIRTLARSGIARA
ncbi:MAG: murein peptide amidase, partial [Actinomycetota bacterium]|nr:murein peptide amidase [Actinomycetota bacterium]